jgi:hypothetical protein
MIFDNFSRVIMYDLEEVRSLNVLVYSVDREASRWFGAKATSSISITLELEKSEASYALKWFYDRNKKDIIISTDYNSQKLLGCYIRNINNFEYSISVEISADILYAFDSKELVADIRDIKLEELLK